MKNSQGGSKW